MFASLEGLGGLAFGVKVYLGPGSVFCMSFGVGRRKWVLWKRGGDLMRDISRMGVFSGPLGVGVRREALCFGTVRNVLGGGL